MKALELTKGRRYETSDMDLQHNYIYRSQELRTKPVFMPVLIY